MRDASTHGRKPESLDEVGLIRPDDWHAHFRDGAVLADVVPASAARFARAVAMPNLLPPVTTTGAALAYRDRILAAAPRGAAFEPLMTLYLTDDTGADEVRRAAASGKVIGVKLYPAGATTHSAHGVTDVGRCDAALDAMQECGLALMVHGEAVEADVDVFDRERVFIERTLATLVDRFPGLKVVLEHVTTADGVEFVRGARDGVAATITAHHLLLNRNAIFEGGLRPHHYCLPVLKREHHRIALVAAATGGEARFFLGTDLRPASPPRQGDLMRMRRPVHRACRDRALRGSVRSCRGARRAGSVRIAQRSRVLRTRAEPGEDHAVQEALDGPGHDADGRRRTGAVSCREPGGLESRAVRGRAVWRIVPGSGRHDVLHRGPHGLAHRTGERTIRSITP